MFTRSLLQDTPTAPRVPISDGLSPAAVAVFRERGVEVDGEVPAAVLEAIEGLPGVRAAKALRF